MKRYRQVASTIEPCPSLPLALLQPLEASYHALGVGWCPGRRGTLRGMSIAEAVPTDNKLIEGIIVFLPDLPPRVKQVVSQCVKPSQVHTEVGDLQQV